MTSFHETKQLRSARYVCRPTWLAPDLSAGAAGVRANNDPKSDFII